MTKGILRSIAIKNKLHKMMCHSKDPFNRREIETKLKITRKCYLSLPKRVKQTILITFSVRIN